MKKFKVRGTLGDAYVMLHILYKLAIKEPVLLYQCPFFAERTDNWEPLIEQIYSLVPGITVKFIGRSEFEKKKARQIFPSFARSASLNICPVTPKIRIKLPPFEGLPQKYIALSPRGGKSNEKNRHIGYAEVESLLSTYPNHSFVMVGDNPEYAECRKANLINLNGKTDILEAMGIVASAEGFIGVQGLQAYVATSQGVPSVVYTKSIGYDKAFRSRMLEQWLACCLVLKTHRTEKPEEFIQFIKAQHAQS